VSPVQPEQMAVAAAAAPAVEWPVEQAEPVAIGVLRGPGAALAVQRVRLRAGMLVVLPEACMAAADRAGRSHRVAWEAPVLRASSY
jgi:hypothetical protein